MADAVNVLLVGLDEGFADELAREEGFTVQRADDLEALAPGVDAVVVALESGPLELVGTVRATAPDAAVVVVTDPDREVDGAVAMHAGAEDHLVRGEIPAGLLPRAIRYAVNTRRLRRELATQDELTDLPNLRGFGPIAEHHLRIADRARTAVVFLFVRLDGFTEAAASSGPEEAAAMVREAAGVLLQAVRDADVPARVADDTFCVLLTGDARGAENLVLSRLVEAIAVHNAGLAAPRPLSVSVGSALYDPEQTTSLEQILQTAGRRLSEQRAESSDAR